MQAQKTNLKPLAWQGSNHNFSLFRRAGPPGSGRGQTITFHYSDAQGRGRGQTITFHYSDAQARPKTPPLAQSAAQTLADWCPPNFAPHEHFFGNRSKPRKRRGAIRCLRCLLFAFGTGNLKTGTSTEHRVNREIHQTRERCVSAGRSGFFAWFAWFAVQRIS